MSLFTQLVPDPPGPALWFLLGTKAGQKSEKSKLDKAVKVIQDVAKKSGLEPDCIEVLMDYILGEEGVSGSGCGILSVVLIDNTKGVSKGVAHSSMTGVTCFGALTS